MAFAAFSTNAAPVEAAPRKRSWIAPVLLLPGLAYLALFFLVPLVSLLLTSLQATEFGPVGKEFVYAFQWENYSQAISEYLPHIGRSFFYSITATIFALLIGYPLAYLMGVTLRESPLWKSVVLMLVIAPFFFSFLLRALAWKQIFADEGPVVAVLNFLGILGPGGYLNGTDFSVIFGLTYTFIPFMTLPIYTSLDRLDIRYLEAAGDLYGKPATNFWKVTIPLSMPGIVSGTLLTFIPASGDYVNASNMFLGGPGTAMIGNVIESNYLITQNFPIAAALSISLMAVILVAVSIYVRRSGTEDLL